MAVRLLVGKILQEYKRIAKPPIGCDSGGDLGDGQGLFAAEAGQYWLGTRATGDVTSDRDYM